ncbi:MAG TPA: Crp/Fnr family transcriptional regulator [Solirubrobacteraceae bacterium]|nr:Crp/Fnr family transcriptional regulator [Solirubrobacteraceae bacterium]
MTAARYGRQSFLESLSDTDRQALLETGHLRRWDRGDSLVREGDRADSATVLLAGLVKVHKSTSEGADVVLGLSGPGDLLGEVSTVRGATRSASVTALEEGQGLVLAVPDLRAFLASHPQAALALLELTLARLYAADARRLEFASTESLARVTSRLVELVERFGQARDAGQIEVALPFNQEELASWSASSRESTARALRTLRELGLIQTHRLRLTVLDLDGLRLHAARL